MSVSVDGCMEGPNREIDWHMVDDELHRHMNAWIGGARIRSSGNSFATPHMSAICTLILAKHPELTPFQLKSVLYLTASNVGGANE